MSVTLRPFGEYRGETVTEAVLTSDTGVSVSVLSYGCVIRDWRVPVRRGPPQPVVLGFDRFEYYPLYSKSFGIIAGRVANRIAGSRFMLDGEAFELVANEGPNHLHGGPGGLGRRLWRMQEAGDDAVRLTLTSEDGDQGYPGRVDFEVVASLDGTALTFEMTGTPDRPTPVSLAQHNYYNLSAGPTTLDHILTVDADRFTPVDKALIPSGDVLPVDGTRYDFRKPRGFLAPSGRPVFYDQNLCLAEGRRVSEPAAELASPSTGLRLRIFTEEPAIQLFNASVLDIPVRGLDGREYGPYGGICLEAQHWPDAVHHASFPSIIRTPAAPYRQTLRVDIAGD